MLTLQGYLNSIKKLHPEELLTIEEEVNPANFEVTAILRHLELAGKYPLVYFSRPLNLKGEVSQFPFVINIFATRRRCALAMGLDVSQWMLPLSLEYARRHAHSLPPEIIPKGEAPVKQIVKTEDKVDLREFPIARHHDMDLGPYIDMIPLMRDSDTGAYNAAFQRTVYKGPRKLGLYMDPRHNWEIARKNEAVGRGTPVVIVVSHHPAFSLGALNVAPFDTDDYEVIGSIMGEPLRITPSETWGDNFMVPADADILIEGEVLPHVREIEGPFGEFTGYFGPQRYSWVVEVKAITHRRDAIYQGIFVGHRDTWILGAIPKEGSIYNAVRAIVPTVRAVHFANSGCGRFNCYISIAKKTEGDSKQAALIALGQIDFIKNVIIVDADIDPFNEEEVLWCVATRVQADSDVDILKNIKGSALDPSLRGNIVTAKMIIDATRSLERPFANRLEIPPDVLDKVEPLLRKKNLI